MANGVGNVQSGNMTLLLRIARPQSEPLKDYYKVTLITALPIYTYCTANTVCAYAIIMM